MSAELKTLPEQFSLQIRQLRNTGLIDKAIKRCEEAEKLYPDDYLFPKVRGDLFFQKADYENAASAFTEFLVKIPPTSNHLLFGDFAKRYYRLRRVWSQERISQYAGLIMLEIRNSRIKTLIAMRCETLIQSDLPREVNLSPEGKKLVQLISEDTPFHELTKQAKKLEATNPAELELALDGHILNRERTVRGYPFDAYCISHYHKFERYEAVFKIAEELLVLRLDGVVVRSHLNACRELGNYERAERLFRMRPEILKSEDFNIMYELVYYFEAHDNFGQVQTVLNRIEKNSSESLPIQKTVRNFYLRFGLIADVERVRKRIAELEAASRKGSERYNDEVRESENEVGSKIQELYSKLEHQTRLAAFSDLTSGISHELGQPITNIRYTVQFYRRLFKKEIKQDDVFKVFDSILEETERMGGLIKRLAPITSSQSVTEIFDLMERIRKRVNAEETRLRKNVIRVKIMPDGPLHVFGDPVKFDQLISNLLLNSIDAITEKKKQRTRWIDIRVEKHGETVKIAFKDNGVGIHASHRGKIFDPFFSTKSPGKGEGLGLFIVWNLLMMQGGKIELDPNHKNGACFIITIPQNARNEQET